MTISDKQFRKLMNEMRNHGNLSRAALRAGMAPNTARKYVTQDKVPSEAATSARAWQTRANPFEEDWVEITARLSDCPDLEAKTIFESLTERSPTRYQPGQLRTLQRHMRRWRALEGPPKEVFFQQEHKPGEAMQTDFTCATELGITIAGEPLPHMICHPVLPYSNWEWGTICRSESTVALKRGMQAALVRLGRSPEFSQTDNGSAMTHDIRNGRRKFNEEYENFVTHYSMKPRTIGIGESNQNGDVESSNNALKRYMKQQLLVRASSDFATVDDYESFLHECFIKRNQRRQVRFQEELERMSVIPTSRFPEFTRQKVRVTKWSTINVCKNAYSVDSRLKHEHVWVHVFDDRLEVYFASKRIAVIERLIGNGGHRINYRHVIWSLVRKPGAFRLYRYREDFFPSEVFRRAYDNFRAQHPDERRADLEYLRLLHLAATTTETAVAAALEATFEAGRPLQVTSIKEAVAPTTPKIPELDVPSVNLSDYDSLLTEEVA